MKDTASARRLAVTASLVLGPVLALVSVVLMPPFAPDYADRLADLDAAGPSAVISGTAFLLMQVAMLVAFVGIARLVRPGAPRLANIAAGLAVLATMGEAVMGGVSMVYLRMAQDPGSRDVFAGVWEQVEGSPVMLFALVGFGGTVIVHLLLSVALFRTRVVPRWVPALVVAFLVLEFFGQGLSEYASYAAVLCLLIGYAAIARVVWQQPSTLWADAPLDSGERVPVG